MKYRVTLSNGKSTRVVETWAESRQDAVWSIEGDNAGWEAIHVEETSTAA